MGKEICVQSHSSPAVLGLIFAALALVGCGTISRQSYHSTRPSLAALPPDDIRILTNDADRLKNLAREISARWSGDSSAVHSILPYLPEAQTVHTAPASSSAGRKLARDPSST